jgi:peptidoglycan/xylan/chitin deacetylase (PgdA/CDA1 family)
MNQLKKYFFSLVAGRISTPRLLSQFAQPMIIHPFYHAISDKYVPHLKPLHRIKTFEEFRKDLDFLLRYFQPVDAETVLLCATGEKTLKKHSFHLSFDGGLREVYTVVLPYLYRKGIPATAFINNGFVNNTQLFYQHKAALIVDFLAKKEPSSSVRKEIEDLLQFPSKKSLTERILALPYAQRENLDSIAALLGINFKRYLQVEQPYLTPKQLIDMQKKGFSLGGHSIDHPPFPEIEETEQVHQIIASVGDIKRFAPDQHRYFAFPFTDEGVTDTVFQIAYRKNKRGPELTFGAGGIGTRFGGRHIARIDMECSGRDAKEAVNNALLKIK